MTLTDLYKKLNKEHNEILVDLKDAQKIPALPTGSFFLDQAIGMGGYPFGRLVEIAGNEGSGKCLTGDSYILSDKGMLTVTEFFEENGIVPSCTNKTIEKSAKLLNEKGALESTSNFYNNGRLKVYKFVTNLGNEIKVTTNHPLRVMDESGFIIWKRADEIETGDHVILLSNTNCFGTNGITTDEARLLGYLIADGTLTVNTRTLFSNSDPDVIEDFHYLWFQVFPETKKILKHIDARSKGINWHINDKVIREKLFSKYGLDFTKAAGKKVPKCIRTASKEVVINFLRGYFELECSIDPERYIIEVTSASEILLRQVQLMLFNLGIVAALRTKIVNEIVYWRLTVRAKHYKKFGDIIGFSSKARLEVYTKMAPREYGIDHDIIPFIGKLVKVIHENLNKHSRAIHEIFRDVWRTDIKVEVSYPHLRKCVDIAQKTGFNFIANDLFSYLKFLADKDYIFAQIVSKEFVGREPVFDVEMPESHSFWSNGFISHNSSLATTACINIQKMGYAAVYLDFEHAFDPTYAEKLGLKLEPDKFFLLQPYCFEDGVDALYTILENVDNVKVIVLDSVSAMTPRSQMEGTSEDVTIGLLARKMSEFLAKVVKVISEKDILLIAVNQIRSKISFGFHRGPPETETSGGRAVRFYASVRLHLNCFKHEYIERPPLFGDKNEKLAVRDLIGADVIKNKVAPGHRKALLAITYGYGLDDAYAMAEIGKKSGVITQSRGPVFTCKIGGEEVSLKGREELLKFLRSEKGTSMVDYFKKVIEESYDINVEGIEDES